MKTFPQNLDPSSKEKNKPKWWQQRSFRLSILTLILICLIGIYVWKQFNLHSNTSNTQKNNQILNFDQYLDNLVNKLHQNPGPNATTAPLISTPSPTPTPKPLPHGIQIYNFSHGKNVQGPKPLQVTIDPIDPKLNTYQRFSVKIKHSQPVTSAQIILITDNYSQTIPLSLKSGTNLDGIWTAKYKITHNYNYHYQIKMIFSDSQTQFKGALTFR